MQIVAEMTYFKHLCNGWVLVDIDIQVFKLAIVALDGVDQHGFEDVARSTPWSSSLDHDWSFSVLKSILPICLRFHFLDVAGLATRFVSVGWSVWGTAIDWSTAIRSVESLGRHEEWTLPTTLAPSKFSVAHRQHLYLARHCEDRASHVLRVSRLCGEQALKHFLHLHFGLCGSNKFN